MQNDDDNNDRQRLEKNKKMVKKYVVKQNSSTKSEMTIKILFKSFQTTTEIHWNHKNGKMKTEKRKEAERDGWCGMEEGEWYLQQAIKCIYTHIQSDDVEKYGSCKANTRLRTTPK